MPEAWIASTKDRSSGKATADCRSLLLKFENLPFYSAGLNLQVSFLHPIGHS